MLESKSSTSFYVSFSIDKENVRKQESNSPAEHRTHKHTQKIFLSIYVRLTPPLVSSLLLLLCPQVLDKKWIIEMMFLCCARRKLQRK